MELTVESSTMLDVWVQNMTTVKRKKRMASTAHMAKITVVTGGEKLLGHDCAYRLDPVTQTTLK